MKANLYLHNDCFRYNGVDTCDQIVSKVKRMVGDMSEVINKYKEDNDFCVQTTLPITPIYKNQSIIDIASDYLNHDEKGILFTIIGNTSNGFDSIDLNDIRKLCKFKPDETVANTLLVLNERDDASSEVDKEYISFDEYRIVYDKSSWRSFRRQILGNHPGTEASFLSDCSICFPDLCFSKHCSNSLVDSHYRYLELCPRKLVYYLACLNDKFCDMLNEYNLSSHNPNSLLAAFSGKYGLEEPGSIEANSKKKDELTFPFCFNGIDINVKCEPHLKISVPDSNYCGSYNSKTFNPRIYFCYQSKLLPDNMIFVGSMGKHI